MQTRSLPDRRSVNALALGKFCRLNPQFDFCLLLSFSRCQGSRSRPPHNEQQHQSNQSGTEHHCSILPGLPQNDGNEERR